MSDQDRTIPERPYGIVDYEFVPKVPKYQYVQALADALEQARDDEDEATEKRLRGMTW